MHATSKSYPGVTHRPRASMRSSSWYSSSRCLSTWPIHLIKPCSRRISPLRTSRPSSCLVQIAVFYILRKVIGIQESEYFAKETYGNQRCSRSRNSVVRPFVGREIHRRSALDLEQAALVQCAGRVHRWSVPRRVSEVSRPRPENEAKELAGEHNSDDRKQDTVCLGHQRPRVSWSIASFGRSSDRWLGEKPRV